MSKKKALQKATEAAERILENKAKIKELQAEVKKDMKFVCKHSEETGHRRYGNAEIYERMKPAKIVLPAGMKDDDFRKKLNAASLRKYTETIINKKLIIDSCHEDEELRNLLEELEVEIIQENGLHIKHF